MAFVWSNSLTGKVEASDIAEIITNTQTLANNKGVSLTLVANPTAGSKILKSTVQNIQDNLDVLKDTLVCQSYFADKDTVIDTTKYVTVDNDYVNNSCTSVNSGLHSTYYSTIDNSDNYGVYTSEDTSALSTDNSNIYSSNNVLIYGTKNSRIDSSQNATIYSDYNSGYDGDLNVSVQGVESI